jgi:hypothetical protein
MLLLVITKRVTYCVYLKKKKTFGGGGHDIYHSLLAVQYV